MRVVVQQQKRLFRDGLAVLLDETFGIEVVAAVTTAEELLETCRDRRPDVAVIALDAANYDPVSDLMRQVDGLKVVAVSETADPAGGDGPPPPGVSAVVHRHAGFGAILEAISARSQNGSPSRNGRAEGRAANGRTRLTRRETDILTFVGRGWTSHGISRQLGISPKTVENHKQRIFTKFGVQNQAHAVALALRNGAISPDRIFRIAE